MKKRAVSIFCIAYLLLSPSCKDPVSVHPDIDVPDNVPVPVKPQNPDPVQPGTGEDLQELNLLQNADFKDVVPAAESKCSGTKTHAAAWTSDAPVHWDTWIAAGSPSPSLSVAAGIVSVIGDDSKTAKKCAVKQTVRLSPGEYTFSWTQEHVAKKNGASYVCVTVSAGGKNVDRHLTSYTAGTGKNPVNEYRIRITEAGLVESITSGSAAGLQSNDMLQKWSAEKKSGNLVLSVQTSAGFSGSARFSNLKITKSK
ncbi:hypothetical protein [Treponema brennaborense]|uniref:Uncharacterized protein n=1 Tax=Treponema brennaborense (strain DSM 12168 / CIP 105900 / DD5/3) TaxID=906968 RepID=F4LPB6_TREBD|nr:hypothetical protein [Treponema brennaborense]AEE16978.1 hypothetical protein Trebr_1555 [Treponema brennaborense DSM 12168]